MKSYRGMNAEEVAEQLKINEDLIWVRNDGYLIPLTEEDIFLEELHEREFFLEVDDN